MGTVGAERDRYILDAVRVPLTEHLPGVAGRLTEQILAEDDAYAALIPREELRARILQNLQEALASLLEYHAGRPVDLSDAVRTGRIRAEQGLPLASLQNAYRLGGRRLWAAMIETVAAESPDALPSLLPCAGDLWDVLDLVSGAVADSYRLAESERLARDAERRNALLDVLLGGLGARVPVGQGAGLVAEAAAFLGLTERGRYAVAVVRSARHGDETAVVRPGTSDAGGMRILWRIRADHEVGLIALGACDLDEVVCALAERRTQAGISPEVGSLGDLGRARWLAEIALQTCVGTRDEVVRLDDRLPAALVAAQSELAERLQAAVLAPVLRLPAAERDVLLRTLTAWLECGGSAAAAAARLYCHRNTVFNRLRRLEQLTTRSITDPWQLVELALAAEAVRQVM